MQELLAKPVYYSLYMHLNYLVEISGSNEKLKDYPWLPRTQIVPSVFAGPTQPHARGCAATQ